MTADSDIDGKLAEVETLQHTLDSAADRLLELISDQDGEIRCRALEVLAHVRRPDVASRVEAALSDPDELVRTTACELIGALTQRQSRGQLLRRLADSSWLVRSAAAVSLATMGASESVDAIKARIADADEEEAIRLYFALTMLGESEYMSRFLDGLFSEHYRVRCATANLVMEVATDANREFLRHLLGNVLNSEDSIAARSSLEKAIMAVGRDREAQR